MTAALGDIEVDDLGYRGVIRWKEGTDHRPGRWDKPARTLTHNPNGDGSLLALPRFVVSSKHPPSSMNSLSLTVTGRSRESNLVSVGGHEVIVLNERSRLILQGFPPDWQIVGETKGSRDSQIGLAMPPPMARTIAVQIKERE